MHRLGQLFENIRTIKLLGGEPLLHPDVLTFARHAREAFPRASVVLLTNGLLVPKLSDDFWGAAMALRLELEMSVYPVAIEYERIERTAARHGVRMRTSRRQTFCRIPLHEAADNDERRAFRDCRKWMNCPVLRDGRVYPCPRIPYVELLERQFGIKVPVADDDSIDIRGAADGYEVARFVRRPVLWCRHCHPRRVESYPWAPSRRQPEEWGLEAREDGSWL
jgi:MoaA/NifB/PqqE/SkfB family radical SAM enzyme